MPDLVLCLKGPSSGLSLHHVKTYLSVISGTFNSLAILNVPVHADVKSISRAILKEIITINETLGIHAKLSHADIVNNHASLTQDIEANF